MLGWWARSLRVLTVAQRKPSGVAADNVTWYMAAVTISVSTSFKMVSGTAALRLWRLRGMNIMRTVLYNRIKWLYSARSASARLRGSTIQAAQAVRSPSPCIFTQSAARHPGKPYSSSRIALTLDRFAVIVVKPARVPQVRAIARCEPRGDRCRFSSH